MHAVEKAVNQNCPLGAGKVVSSPEEKVNSCSSLQDPTTRTPPLSLKREQIGLELVEGWPPGTFAWTSAKKNAIPFALLCVQLTTTPGVLFLLIHAHSTLPPLPSIPTWGWGIG